jgi:hypothetical protein
MGKNIKTSVTLADQLVLKIKLAKGLISRKTSPEKLRRINKELKRSAVKTGVDIEILEE